MEAEFWLLHAIMLLHCILDLNQLAAYGSPFQCSKQKQVQNDDSTSVILLVVALSSWQKSIFLVHLVNMF